MEPAQICEPEEPSIATCQGRECGVASTPPTIRSDLPLARSETTLRKRSMLLSSLGGIAVAPHSPEQMAPSSEPSGQSALPSQYWLGRMQTMSLSEHRLDAASQQDLEIQILLNSYSREILFSECTGTDVKKIWSPAKLSLNPRLVMEASERNITF